MSETDSGPWYKEAFTELYSEIYGHRDRREADEAIELLSRHVSVTGTLVLDLACGSGRHLGPLADAGARPVGLDLSSPLLRGARLSGQRDVLRGDMRALPFRSNVFGGAISMFTSFGYFTERQEEMSVLLEVARCLKERGWFVLDYMNSVLVRGSLKPLSRRKVGELDVVERRRLDSNGEKVIKEVEIFAEGRRLKEHTEVVRLLSRKEITDMLAEAGLSCYLVLGDYSGAPYMESISPRLITFCVRE
jgi:SAM-dependent methyltransferase